MTSPVGEETQIPSPEPTPEVPKAPIYEVYFTVNTFPNYNSDLSDDWIIIHDEQGKLLEYRPFESGDQLLFERDSDSLPEFFTVSRLQYSFNETSKYFEINTSCKTAQKSELNLGSNYVSNIEPLTKTGDFDITINNIPVPPGKASPIKDIVSTKIGRLGGVSSGSAINGLSKLIKTTAKYEKVEDYIVTILDGNDNLRYYNFQNALSQDITVDYSNAFQNFDTYLNVYLPTYSSYNMNIAGFEDGQVFDQNGGYWLHNIISVIDDEIKTAPLIIGYLDKFKRYRTQFNISMADYNYYISQYGDPLLEIVIPEKPNMTITDQSIENFRFQIDIDFLSAGQRWEYKEGAFETNDYSQTRWSIEVPYGYEQYIGEIPDEILEKYPTININKLQFKQTSLNLPMAQSEYFSSQGITIYNQ
tara:strand:- start:2655 stop:3905 length:1251 start_codon:yes stop_codon:yes gene_type:complete